MKNYDFGILSPFEFECLSRDLLRKRDGLDYSNFAEGRDGGIDLRASLAQGGTVIAQAKRYKSYSQLKSVLAKEVSKVARLRPMRYVVTTSVDLTAKNIDEIKNMFSPYIKSENDVMGKQYLNKLLEDNKDVEYQYYKLWLSSSDVLEAFLKKRIVNDSLFAMEDIKECVHTYVMNPSFNKALEVLRKNSYVIISGMPGIGKTSLARMLVYYLLSKKGGGYEQFYFIPNQIDDFSEVFQEGVKQIFFFDDFLGNTRFNVPENNFDAKLISRIKAVQRHSDKLFILTTREYVLNDAKKYFPLLESNDIEIAKCIVDLGEYSKWVKGQILYNHLEASGMDEKYVNAILMNRNYMKLIEHKNFNPRIIETFVRQSVSETCPPETYFTKILNFFNSPGSVWTDAFEQLELHAREMMLVLASMVPPVMYSDWREAYHYFYDTVYQRQGYLDEHEWEGHVKTLMNSFITVVDGLAGRFVDYINPGIKDFIIDYISSRDTILKRLLEHSYYIEQLFAIFQDGSHPFIDVRVPNKLSSVVLDNFDRLWADYRSCKILRMQYNASRTYCKPYPMQQIEAVYRFMSSYSLFIKGRPGFIEKKLTHDILFNRIETLYGLYVLNEVDISKLSADEDEIFSFYKNNICQLYEYRNFIQLLNSTFVSHKDCKDDSAFLEGIDSAFFEAVAQDNADYDDLESDMQYFQEALPAWDSSEVSAAIDEGRRESERNIDAIIEDYEFRGEDGGEYEDRQIDNLFASLKE